MGYPDPKKTASVTSPVPGTPHRRFLPNVAKSQQNHEGKIHLKPANNFLGANTGQFIPGDRFRGARKLLK